MRTTSHAEFVVDISAVGDGDYSVRTIAIDGTMRVSTIAEELEVAVIRPYDVEFSFIPAPFRTWAFAEIIRRIHAVGETEGIMVNTEIAKCYKILHKFTILGDDITRQLLIQQLAKVVTAG